METLPRKRRFIGEILAIRTLREDNKYVNRNRTLRNLTNELPTFVVPFHENTEHSGKLTAEFEH